MRTVADGSHAVLTHSKAEVALSILVLLEVTEHLHEGEVGACQISRATPEARDLWGECVKHGLGVCAGGEALVLGGVGGESLLPALRVDTSNDGVELLGLLRVLGLVGVKVLLPISFDNCAGSNGALCHGLHVEVCQNLSRGF